MGSLRDYEVIQGDALPFLKGMEPRSVDLIIFDPPYGVSNELIIKRPSTTDIDFSFGEWDKIDESSLFALLYNYYKEFYRLLKPQGSVYTFHRGENSTLMLHIEQKTGFFHKTVIVWIKPNPIPQFRKVNYLSAHEDISFAVKDNNHFTFNFGKQNEMLNWIKCPVVSGAARTSHPTQKPTILLRRLINISSNYGDVVLDPMMGSGSTGVAALALGRKFIGIEIDPEYCKLANHRIRKTEVGGKPLW
jgi:DNA modification methylase